MNKNNENSFWEQQKNGQWKSLISSLKNDSEIHSHFNDFITTFYWKFREKKGIAKDAYPEVDFQGFKEFEEHERRAGHCFFDAFKDTETTYTNGQETGKTVKINIKLDISLNQYFLLDRLGMDKLFSSENTYTPIGFNELIETIAHELAHAYQQTANNFEWEKERSQCESTGDKNKYPELVAEHTALTSEIKSVIESSTEYQNFKEWWEADKININENEKQDSSEKNKQTDTDDSKIMQETKKELEEKIKLEAELTGKVKDAEEKLQFGELISVLNRESSKDLTSLANAYQKVVKTNPLYTTAKKSFADNDEFNKKNASNNQEYLDNIYNGLLYYISCKLSKLETTCPKCKTKKNEMMPEYPDDWESKKNAPTYCSSCNSQQEKRLFCSECNENLVKENGYLCQHIGKYWEWKNDKEKQEYQHKPASGQKDLNDKLNNQEPAPRAKETTNWILTIALISLIGLIIWSVFRKKRNN